MSFYYLELYDLSFDEQIAFLAILGLNLIVLPILIKHTKLKKLNIIDPMINGSYSSISIHVINLLKFLLYV